MSGSYCVQDIRGHWASAETQLCRTVGIGERLLDKPIAAKRPCTMQAVFHAERGLEWVVFAQQHQHAVVTALANWSCATVTVTFYATFLPILVCER